MAETNKFLFNESHEQVRMSFARFLDEKVVDVNAAWSKAGQVNEQELRAIYEEMGRYGWLMPWAEEEYGGVEADFITSYVLCNEIGKRALNGLTTWLHSEVAGPYIGKFGSKEQKERYMPGMISGEKIACVAMTEPDAGSDLSAIKTSAVRDGDYYIINGNKTFITNGLFADVIILACKTGTTENGQTLLSLLIVDGDSEGITRHDIDKIGGNEMESGEIYFDNVKIPVENLLGVEGAGMNMIFPSLQKERFIASVLYQGYAERALQLSIEYSQERIIFGKRVADFQNTSFTIADMYVKTLAGRALIENLAMKLNVATEKDNFLNEASAVKVYSAELAQECAHKGVQIHGGYGVCRDYEIGRIFASSPVFSIAAGTTEVMKHIISRSLLKNKSR